MTQWRLRCRECNQPKPPRVLTNYHGLGKDNDVLGFAPTGCTESETSASHDAAPHPPNGSTSFKLSPTYEARESLKTIFVLPFSRPLQRPPMGLARLSVEKQNPTPTCQTPFSHPFFILHLILLQASGMRSVAAGKVSALAPAPAAAIRSSKCGHLELRHAAAAVTVESMKRSVPRPRQLK